MSAGMEDPAAAAKRAALHDLTNKGAMSDAKVRRNAFPGTCCAWPPEAPDPSAA